MNVDSHPLRRRGVGKAVIRGLLGASLLATWTDVGFAQVMSFQPQLMNGFIGANALRAATREGERRFGGDARLSRPDPAGFRAPLARTDYRRDPAVTRRVEAQFADYVARIAGPQKAAMVRRDLAAHDFASVWRATAAENGLRTGDVADAFAAYWVLNWAMANGQDAEPRQAQAVRAQLAGTFAHNPGFARMTGVQRQELAEVYMLNFIYQQATYADAAKRGDHELMTRLADAAEQRFRTEMDLDLRRLALTDRGFVQRG